PNVTPAYWAANGHQRQINSDIFKFITSVWGILVHAVGKKAPSGATGKNSLIMDCSLLWSVPEQGYSPGQKCRQDGENVEIQP
ncbi:hypothetical protein WCV54_29070, partial [Klebsiella pneumoniae]|uniref:hypothetical protein n=1 Tax=Klebsiella pneumoniae TaxID=573 RepID=UPI00301606F9